MLVVILPSSGGDGKGRLAAALTSGQTAPQDLDAGKGLALQPLEESAAGGKTYQKLLKEDKDRQIEKVGSELRARMPWLNEKRT